MKRHLWGALALLACYSSYSHSEIVYGTSSTTGLNWVMTQILPEYAGLEINGLVYQYTTVKDADAAMIVTVANENINGGYIFRDSEDWSGVPGNTIRKKFILPNSLAELWGGGSITWTGEGDVTDASILYSYKYDTCFDPQSDPSCPGYEEKVEVPEIPFVDPLSDEFIIMQMEQQAKIDEQQEEEDRRRRQRENAIESAIEKVLGDGSNPKLADAELQAAKLAELYKILPVTYYNGLYGGVYEETVVLSGGEIKDSLKGRKAVFRQEALHETMINLQYER